MLIIGSKQRPSRWSSNQGFNLAELLLAAAILATVITQLLVLFMNCTSANEGSRNLSIATSHAQWVLEDIRNTTFATVSSDIAGGTWNYSTSAVTAAGLTALNSESITTQCTGTNPLDVIVTVTWKDKGNRARTKVLETLISG